MKIGSSAWKEAIVSGAREFGIRVNRDQVDQFAMHACILSEWNQKINLTTIVDPLEMAIKHFLDAIVAYACIHPGGRLLDVGSGAGFPGIALKVMIPTLQVTLVEATRKKVSFLKQVIRELGLHQIEALHTRIENLNMHKKTKYDVIVSRAFSDLPKFINLSLPYLASTGQIIAYRAKGQAPQVRQLVQIVKDQLDRQKTALPGADFQVTSHPFLLPVLHLSRTLVRLQFRNTAPEN